MSQEYIYGVARVRAREVSPAGEKRSGTADGLPRRRRGACGVLRDKGWDSVDTATAEEILSAEEERTWAFLGELTRDTAPFGPLLVPTDCNNLKAAIKCAVKRAGAQRGVPSREAVGNLASFWPWPRSGTSPPCPSCWPRPGKRPSPHLAANRSTGRCATGSSTGPAWTRSSGLARKAGSRCWRNTASGPWQQRISKRLSEGAKPGRSLEFFHMALTPCDGLDTEDFGGSCLPRDGSPFELFGNHPLQ